MCLRIIYKAFVESELDVPKPLARRVHDPVTITGRLPPYPATGPQSAVVKSSPIRGKTNKAFFSKYPFRYHSRTNPRLELERAQGDVYSVRLDKQNLRAAYDIECNVPRSHIRCV